MGRSGFSRANVEKMKVERDVEGLIKALNYKKDRDVRRDAAKALGQIGNTRNMESVIPLVQALKYENEEIRTEAAWFLEQIEKADTTEPIIPLIQALKDKKEEVRTEAAKAIGKIGDQRATKHLVKALKDKERNVRVEATKAIRKIGDPRTIKPLIKALKDEEEDVRLQAVKAIEKIGDPRAAKHLVKALKDEDGDVRVEAAKALGQIGDLGATKHLVKALKDEEEDVRIEAVKAIGEIGDPRAIKPLIKALKDRYKDVWKVAKKAFGKIKFEKEQWDKLARIGEATIESLMGIKTDENDESFSLAAETESMKKAPFAVSCSYCGTEVQIQKCIVCNLPIFDDLTKTPCCKTYAHYVHLKDWLKTKEKCPHCGEKLEEWEIEQKTQLTEDYLVNI